MLSQRSSGRVSAESTSKWSPKPLGVHAARVHTAGLMADALVQHPRQDVRAFSLQCRMRARASAGSLSLLSWLSALIKRLRSLGLFLHSCALGLRGDHEAGVQIPCFERLSSLLIKPTCRMAAGLVRHINRYEVSTTTYGEGSSPPSKYRR